MGGGGGPAPAFAEPGWVGGVKCAGTHKRVGGWVGPPEQSPGAKDGTQVQSWLAGLGAALRAAAAGAMRASRGYITLAHDNPRTGPSPPLRAKARG